MAKNYLNKNFAFDSLVSNKITRSNTIESKSIPFIIFNNNKEKSIIFN